MLIRVIMLTHFLVNTTKLIYIVLNPAHVPVFRIKTGRTLPSAPIILGVVKISQRRGSLIEMHPAPGRSKGVHFAKRVQRPYLKYSVKRVCTLVLLYAACRRRMNPHRIRPGSSVCVSLLY